MPSLREIKERNTFALRIEVRNIDHLTYADFAEVLRDLADRMADDTATPQIGDSWIANDGTTPNGSLQIRN